MTDSPALPFAPVPGRARRDGWTPDRQRRFIEALATIGTVTGAARAVGMSAKSAYALLRRAGPDSDFARAWDAALERGYRDALEIGIRAGVQGERVPVFYGGRQVGEYRRYDDRLALATLRAVAARKEHALARRPVSPGTRADRFHSALRELASSVFPPKPRDL